MKVRSFFEFFYLFVPKSPLQPTFLLLPLTKKGVAQKHLLRHSPSGSLPTFANPQYGLSDCRSFRYFPFPRASLCSFCKILLPVQFQPHRLAAIPVVELPLNGSRIQSPGVVEARIIRTRRRKGFCVGCLPQVFSQRPMAGKRQTSVICLPSFSSFRSAATFNRWKGNKEGRQIPCRTCKQTQR